MSASLNMRDNLTTSLLRRLIALHSCAKVAAPRLHAWLLLAPL